MLRMGRIRNTEHIAHCNQLPHCPRLQEFPVRMTFLWEACIAAADDGYYNRRNHRHSHHGDGLLAGHSHRSYVEVGSP